MPALLHPETGVRHVPNSTEVRRHDDVLVKTFRWAFISDEETLAETAQARLAAARRG